MSKRFLSGINVTGTATLNTVADAGSNTDKFLVLDASNNVSYRTAAELYADLGIGSTAAAYTSTLKHEVKASQTIGKGQAVYVSSADGTNMIVSKASNVSEATSSKTMGLLETSLTTNGKGKVVTEGLLAGLNTNGAVAGDPVWLGVDGALIFGLVNKPVAPAHLVFIGIVTRVQTNNGEIFVKVQNGFEMKELHNYAEGSVQNNEVIVYESATSLYKPKTIPTILGYTPADDASVVRITGAQTVSGLKTFGASIIANIGVLLKNNAVSALNGYTAIGGSSSNGIELVFSPGGFTQSLLFQPTAAYSYTFPAATGTVALISDIPSLAGYVPNTRTLTINGTTYDLSANRAWTITTDASARSILRYVATASQTTFTISGGYTPGLTDVYRNGVKLDNSTDFTATNGTTIVLTNGASVNDVIEVYRYQTAFLANNALRTVTEFIATAGQTTFSVTYNSGLVDVFYNGSKLLSTEYTAGNGTSIVLNFPCNLNDTLEVHAYSYQVGAFSGQSQLSGTGFVKVSGTTVTYDNSTYLTSINSSQVTTALGYTPYNATNPSGYITSSALSAYLPLAGGTLTGALSGTTAAFSSSATAASFSSTALSLAPFINLTYNATAGLKLTYNAADAISYIDNYYHDTVNNLPYGDIRFRTKLGGVNTLVDVVTIKGFTGNVGIGTISPNSVLNVVGNASTNGLTIKSAGNGSTFPFRVTWSGGSDGSMFCVNDNGYVGIGTISPTYLTELSSAISSVIGLRNTTTNSWRGFAFLNGSSDSTQYAYIQYNATSGEMRYYANPAGFGGFTSWYSNAVESMRLTAGGNLLIANTSNAGNYRLVTPNAHAKQYIAFGLNDDGRYIGQGDQISGAFTANDLTIVNYAPSGTRIVISNYTTGVALNNGATSWSSFSDERMKNINSTIENAVDKLLSVRAVDYSWKTDTTQKHNLGLIAQDIEKVFPQVIDKSKSFSETDDTEYLSVRYTELIPVLVKAIQELKAEIDILKAR